MISYEGVLNDLQACSFRCYFKKVLIENPFCDTLNKIKNKNVTPHVDYSDSKGSEGETFINEDAKQIFINNFYSKSAHSEGVLCLIP